MDNLFLNPHIGSPDIEQVPTRNGYGEALLELGNENEKAVVVFPAPVSVEQRERLLMPFLMEKRVRAWNEVLIPLNEPVMVGKALFFRGFSLTAQDAFVGTHAEPEIIVGRFSSRLLWRETLVNALHPNALVELGWNSLRRPSSPPWNSSLHVPQKVGVVELTTAASTEKPDADKARQKSAGVRPPGNATHFATLSQHGNRAQAVHRLDDKPQAEEEERGELNDADEKEDGDQRFHTRVRIENNVTAQNPSDRSRRANHW
jgi:hypothetical protein